MSLRELKPRSVPAVSVPQHPAGPGRLSTDPNIAGSIGLRVSAHGGTVYWGGDDVTPDNGAIIEDGGVEVIPIQKPYHVRVIAEGAGVTARTVIL